MRRFVYVSTASDLHDAEVDHMVAAAERRNAVLSLTGFLFYNRRNFMQMLEGREGAMLTMMSSLARDQRHSGMVTLINEPIAQRTCPEWHMRRLKLAENLERRRIALATELPDELPNHVRELAINFAILD